jgi:hypothetical protein
LPKLKKRLPESRSQKKERLDGERSRRVADRELALKRRERWLSQQEETLVVWKEWRHAIKHRLDSDAAYARFEAAHQQWWDWFRHYGMPDADVTIALQRLRDGRPADPQPLIDLLANSPPGRFASLLRPLRRMLPTPPSPEMRRPLIEVVVRVVDLPFWHRDFRAYARLARRIDDPSLRAALQARVLLGGEIGARAAEVLRYLDFSQSVGRGRVALRPT